MSDLRDSKLLKQMSTAWHCVKSIGYLYSGGLWLGLSIHKGFIKKTVEFNVNKIREITL